MDMADHQDNVNGTTAQPSDTAAADPPSTENRDSTVPDPTSQHPADVHHQTTSVPTQAGSTSTSAAAATTPNISQPHPTHQDAAAAAAACAEFASGMKHQYYRPLYEAALKGDWESTSKFIERDPEALTASISLDLATALMVAVKASQSQFVTKIVELMPTEALLLQDFSGYTALHYAAVAGTVQDAQTMVRKNPTLTQITNYAGETPLLLAASFPANSKDMVWYLSLVTKDEPPSYPFTGRLACRHISFITGAGFYDISLNLIRQYPNLATAVESGRNVLFYLASKPSDFLSEYKLGYLESFIYPFVSVDLTCPPPHSVRRYVEDLHGKSGDLAAETKTQSVIHYVCQVLPIIKQVQEKKMKLKCAVELVKLVCSHGNSSMNCHQIIQFFGAQCLSLAMQVGAVDIVKLCLQHFPILVTAPLTADRNILQTAVEVRQERIYNIILGMGVSTRLLASTLTRTTGENILHLAARLPPSTRLSFVSGPALQLRRELQWFMEVEKLVNPISKLVLNNEGKTARQVFTEQHKSLLEEGEKWMKDTANSCMVVSTLIATVVFAAAFTVPGGNNGDTGTPIFLWNNMFMVFAISDALALFASLTSLLMFLAILTARYAEEDFLESLPRKLIIGLASLFFAIATLMIAFGATLTIVLSERLKWISFPITLLACFPVALFAMLQLPLFVQMVRSMYGSGIFCPQKLW